MFFHLPIQQLLQNTSRDRPPDHLQKFHLPGCWCRCLVEVPATPSLSAWGSSWRPRANVKVWDCKLPHWSRLGHLKSTSISWSILLSLVIVNDLPFNSSLLKVEFFNLDSPIFQKCGMGQFPFLHKTCPLPCVFLFSALPLFHRDLQHLWFHQTQLRPGPTIHLQITAAMCWVRWRCWHVSTPKKSFKDTFW